MQIKEHTNYSHNNGMWFFCILWYDNDKVWQMVENERRAVMVLYNKSVRFVSNITL